MSENRIWTETRTHALIQAREIYKDEFTGKKFSAKDGWEKIKENLAKADPVFGNCDHKILKKKWSNLIQHYRFLKSPPTGAGNEGVVTIPQWPYFEQLDKILGDKHNIKPPYMFDATLDFISEDENNTDMSISNEAVDKPHSSENYSPMTEHQYFMKEKKNSDIPKTCKEKKLTNIRKPSKKKINVEQILNYMQQKDEEDNLLLQRMTAALEKIANK